LAYKLFDAPFTVENVIQGLINRRAIQIQPTSVGALEKLTLVDLWKQTDFVSNFSKISVHLSNFDDHEYSVVKLKMLVWF